ncbi:MAG: hypothetical protein ACR2P0_02215 [Acidimicrobiales bacterium]
MRDLHNVLAWTLIGTSGLVGTWITAGHWAERVRSTSMWIAAHAVFVLVVTQVVVGAALTSGRTDEVDETHMFYGFLTFVAVGVIIGYRQLSEYRYLLYGLGCLFVMGLGIRLVFLDPLAG